MALSEPHTSRSRERARDRRARRRQRALRWAGAIVLLGIVFFAGLAVGRAIEEGPVSEGQTVERTFETVTVTVTVSNP